MAAFIKILEPVMEHTVQNTAIPALMTENVWFYFLIGDWCAFKIWAPAEASVMKNEKIDIQKAHQCPC